MKRKQLKIFLFCNLLILVLELIGLYLIFSAVGVWGFIYYTELSNMFLLIAAAINIYETIKILKSNRKSDIPMTAWRIFHAAVSVTTVTFLVVLFVLSWMYNGLWYVLTAGSMLYTHTLCPLIALGTFITFAPKKFAPIDALKASSFTFIYGLIAIILNVLRVIEGPYPFLLVYRQPIWATIVWIISILGGAYVISRLLLEKKIKK